MKKRNINKDLKLLAKAFYKHLQLLDDGEGWSIGLDSKRPFGNGFVERDVLEIIGLAPFGNPNDEYQEYARELYRERLVPFLKKGK